MFAVRLSIEFLGMSSERRAYTWHAYALVSAVIGDKL